MLLQLWELPILFDLHYDVLSTENCLGRKNFQLKLFIGTSFKNLASLPNGHIVIDLPSTQRRTSTWKIRRDFIDFEKRIHLEIMASIRRGNFKVDSTFKIDETPMSSPHGFFYAILMLHRGNCFTCCFLSIIFKHSQLWESILN